MTRPTRFRVWTPTDREPPHLPTDAGYLLDLAWAVVCISWLAFMLWLGGVI